MQAAHIPLKVDARGVVMALNELSKQILPALETELKTQVARFAPPVSAGFHEMLTYHMGWTEGGTGGGKRIRPLLMLLVVQACGGQWLHALSPAAAIELVHN